MLDRFYRLAIAVGVLIGRPLPDEPFAGLTMAEAAVFSDLFAGFRRDGKAVLLVDHNVKSVAALVDRVIALYLGEKIAEGTATEVMADETVRRVYLGGSIETAARAVHIPMARPPSAIFDDAAVLDANHAIHPIGEVGIMRRDQRRHANLAHAGHQFGEHRLGGGEEGAAELPAQTQ